MTLTTAQQVRGRIQDYPALFDYELLADGRSSSFAVAQGAATVMNITSASAFVLAAGVWSATGAEFNTSGWVTFSGVIPVHSAIRVRGVWSVFSDEEIGHFTAVGGSVNGAALEAVRWLRFDALKRAKWAAPDGSTYDDTAAIAALNKLYDDLRQEVAEADYSDGGSIESWSLGQDVLW